MRGDSARVFARAEEKPTKERQRVGAVEAERGETDGVVGLAFTRGQEATLLPHSHLAGQSAVGLE